MRYHDWQTRMESFVRERGRMPFAWGANDCAVFAAAFVHTITGVDFAPKKRHQNEVQAARALKKHDGLIGVATAALGEPLPPSMAGVGDVVLSKAGDRDMLAICNGTSCMAPGPHGIVYLSMATASMCWRVE